ncbi:hypothetical protein BO71DRAFT_316834, partial [Aspergillus ellipticus CBS 707.79]
EVAWVSVHTRCWELLSCHGLDAIAEKDLNVVLTALRKRWKYTRDKVRDDIPEGGRYHPVRTLCISEAIGQALDQADRRKAKGKPVFCQPVRKRRIRTLPTEILYLIFDHLPSQAMANAKVALGFSLHNAFWRSRISVGFFHEMHDIAGEDLDWKRLCLKLERRPESSAVLKIRRYILGRLDEIFGYCEEDSMIR